MKKTFSIFQFLIMSLFLSGVANADDCLQYKLNPKVRINIPNWGKEVVQPLKPMDLMHGDVAATLVENFDIIVDTTSIEDGICVSLKSVDATVGYNDFMVQIDSRHIPGSCAFNATLAHEDEHIRTYLSVIEDYNNDINSAVYSAANAIMPVFVHNEKDIDNAIDELNKKLQSHPDLVLMEQKIQAEQEIRNKGVDVRDPGTRIKQCMGE